MCPSAISERYRKLQSDRLFQGDILADLDIISVDGSGDGLDIVEKTLPYAVVLTQDCDLEQDYKKRNTEGSENGQLVDILVAPAFPAEQLRDGNHLKLYGLKGPKLNSPLYKPITRQNTARYHFLPRETRLNLPDLIVDFKLVHGVPHAWLYARHGTTYLASLNELFREELSHRFASYLSRIGTPELPIEAPTPVGS